MVPRWIDIGAELIYDTDMKTIRLTNGQEAIVDDEDFDRLSTIKWHGARSRNNTYAQNGRSPAIRMHRMVIDAPSGVFVDHINGNTLDNRKCNLRLCSNAENIRNSKRYSTNNSGLKGVSYIEFRAKWAAKITYNYKKHFLGYYMTKEEAFEAYKAKAKEFFGEYARFE